MVEQKGSVTSQENFTKRIVNPGAEEWLGKEIKVLDHGFVQLIEYMGDDTLIEQAARVSYGEGTRKVSQTEGLIRYLRRNAHTSPFEMGDMIFRMAMPISVARQIVRHRTASLNEYSARYSIVPDVYYVPEFEHINIQSESNRQGRGDVVDTDYAQQVVRLWRGNAERNYEDYIYLLNADEEGHPHDETRPQIARELARNVLSLDFYTQWYWKMDLHNLFHFLKLRMSDHAQWEVRQYANAVAEIVADAYPLSWKAFKDYELDAVNLSGPEQNILMRLFEKSEVEFSDAEIIEIAKEMGVNNKREQSELLDKFTKLKALKR